ncbi:MAG: hypothetical protein U1E13_04920 [Methylophilaceae bacterium]|nr:hypothetical protein [Methylophilaceae bacterium]
MQEMTDQEYLRMKGFLSFFSARYFHVDGLPPEHRPIAVLEALEKKSKKIASSGLKQAINDCLEISRHMNPDDVKKIDIELRNLGTITLTELRKQYSKDYAKIIKRGKIKTETEYYLIRSIFDDNSDKIADEETGLLEKMLFDFESKINPCTK